MFHQSSDIWARGWSYTWEAIFGIVAFCGLMLIIGMINHLIKLFNKEPKFKANKLSLAFFIASPIVVIILLVAEFWWRIDAFYGVSTFYVSYWYEYLIFSIMNFLIILSVWIIKNLYTNRFPAYKEELINMKDSLVLAGVRVKKITIKTSIKTKNILLNTPQNFKNIINLIKNPLDFKNKENTLDSVTVPSAGKVIPLSEVKDTAFAAGHLGDGFAIEIDENVKTINAPISGEIVTLFHTAHAFGIKSKNGTNVLVHIGIDTVKLNGKYFKSLKKPGDKVEVNDPIIKIDLKGIKKSGFDSTTMVVCTQETKGKVTVSKTKLNKKAKNNDKIIVIK